jgi:Retrotransposon gag protein
MVKLAFLTSALEGKALDVVRSTIILNTAHLTHNTIFIMLEGVFKDATIGQRALAQLQSIKQKGNVEGYTREFNTLVRLASGVAILDAGALLRYFLQGLKMNLRVGVVSTQPDTLVVAQTLTSSLDIILQEQQMETKREAMDTMVRWKDEKPKGTCNWCGYKGHYERECRQKMLANQRKRYQVPLQPPSSQLSASIVAGLAIELLTVKLKSSLKLKKIIKMISLT